MLIYLLVSVFCEIHALQKKIERSKLFEGKHIFVVTIFSVRKYKKNNGPTSVTTNKLQ